MGLNNLPLNNIKTQVAKPAAQARPSFNGLFPAQFATTYGATTTPPVRTPPSRS